MTDAIRVTVYKPSHAAPVLVSAPDGVNVVVPALEADDFYADLQSWLTCKSYPGGAVVDCLISREDWDSWADELSVSQGVFDSGYPAATLAPDINLDLPAADSLSVSDIYEGMHFSISECNGLYHWESLQAYADEGQDFDTIGSKEGFASVDDGVTDAKNTLAMITAYGVVAGLKLTAHYDLMQARMWPSDVVAINDAVACLPANDRYIAAYRMALRTKLMPEAYWPAAGA